MALEERIESVDTPASTSAHGAGHPSAKEYVRIAIILFVLTALEITASYTHVSRAILIPTLWGLAIVKFALVALWFMHLKFDDHRYARFFVMGISGACVLYLVVLITFRTFSR